MYGSIVGCFSGVSVLSEHSEYLCDWYFDLLSS